MDSLNTIAFNIFIAALKAVDPNYIIPARLQIVGSKLIVKDGSNHYFFDLRKYRKIFVVGGGKASAAMAVALEKLMADRISGGIVVTKYGYGDFLHCNVIKILEAAHPYPDIAGFRATQELTTILKEATEDDLIITLLSGGCSSLWTFPVSDLTMTDVIETTKSLLACGASIHQVNIVRKHLSGITGGNAALLAYPAEVLVLLISDVIGDSFNTIASGPFFPDDSTFGDCLEIIRYYGIQKKIPQSVYSYLENGFNGMNKETPKFGTAYFSKVTHQLLATNRTALAEAERFAKECGYKTIVLEKPLQGEAQIAAKNFCSFLKNHYENMVSGTLCILAGGETTVSLGDSTGLGGRNQEFALTVALEIMGLDGVAVLCCGTDGTDGPTDAAGAIVNGFTIGEMSAKNIDFQNALANHDSYTILKNNGNLVITGPTFTNVMDLLVAIVTR